MIYNVGDRVKIKGLDWYNENKNNDNCIDLIRDNGYGFNFIEPMTAFCGKVMTISDISCDYYNMLEDSGEYYWTDDMIEGLVEEEDKETNWKPSKEEMDVLYGSNYENMFLNTENDVRRRSTIQVLEYARSLDNYNQYGKADIDKNIAWLEKQGKSAPEARTDNELVEEEVGLIDKLSGRWVNEFNLPDGYIFKDENGNVINATKIVLEKNKKEYPKTYEECKRIMGVELWNTLWGEDATEYEEQTEDLIDAFIRLKVCRDAYWKIAGEEMGLEKPWEPSDSDYITGRYCIFVYRGNIICDTPAQDCILTFPTEEMRDAFKENFGPDIDFCKELLS